MASSSSLGLALSFLLLLLLISRVHCQTCKSQRFTSNEVYSSCLDLPTLTSYLHYTYDKSNSSVSVAFSAPPSRSGGWIAWGINPVADGMVGAQALVAFLDSGGKPVVKTFSLNSYSAVVESKLSFDVWGLSAESGAGVLRIFAKVKVPANAESVSHVWQAGPSVTNGRPNVHEFQAANLNAKGMLSLAGSHNGTTPSVTVVSNSADARIRRRNIHGILNAVSWGFLFPLGVVIARYMRPFESADPAWFYLHVGCQISGYAIGVAGWATGMKLGGESEGIVHTTHRNIGIALFSIATLQMFALFLRPKKDHKYRFFWNLYHHGFGITIIVLGVVNVFKGLNILNPDQHWKSAYLIAILVLGGIAVLLEATTWIIVLRRKSSKGTKPFDGSNNGQGSQRPLSI